MSNRHFATIHVVPLHCVFNDFNSKLVLQVERSLESLTVAVFIDLSDFGASSHVDIIDLVADDQVREVHANL